MKTIAELYEKANGWNPAGFDRTVQELERFAELVRADEREACAKDVEAAYTLGLPYDDVATAIRARGNT